MPNSKEARLLSSKATTIVQQIAAFIGMTSATRQVISVAPLFHWHLQALINRVVPLAASLEEVKQCSTTM